MKSAKKFTALLAITLALILAMSGCTSKSPTKSKTVSLTFATIWTTAQNTVNYPANELKSWEKANPNVKVTMNAYDSSDYLNTIFKTMSAANTLPELFMMVTTDAAFAEKSNELMDLTPMVNGDTKWSGTFLPNLMNECVANGKIYGIPMQFITNEALYYNKDILSKVGYDTFPTDWDSFLTMCGKLKTAGYIPTVIGDKGQWPVCSHFMEIMCEYICGPDWVKAIGAYSTKASYADPKFVSVLTTFNNFVKAGYLNSDWVSLDDNTQDKAYLYNQKAAILWSGSWTASTFGVQAPAALKNSFSVAPIPRPSNTVSDEAGIFTGGSGWEYSISAKVTDPDVKAACENIIKDLTGTKYAATIVESGSLPVNKMADVTGYDASKVPALQLAIDKLISASPSITPMNDEQNGAMAPVLYKEIQAMGVGTETPAQAAQNIEAAYVTACATVAGS